MTCRLICHFVRCLVLFVGLTGCSRSVDDLSSSPTATITCTPAATAELQRVATSLKLPSTTRLRLYAYWPHGNCCPMHDMSFAKEPLAETDRVVKTSPFDFVIPARQLEMLAGTKVDLGDRNGVKGFVILNPNFENGKGIPWQEELQKEPAPVR